MNKETSMDGGDDPYLDLMTRCLTDWIYDGVDDRSALRAATGPRGAGDFDPYASPAAAWVKALRATVVIALGVRSGHNT
jgi:hypothetical protein